MPFTPGESYNRDQIHDLLGGETVSYLPQVDGKIVCGCFSHDSNPEAPFLILVGGDKVYEGHVVEKKARLLEKQREPIPVFLKRADGDWVFEGIFRVKAATRDKQFLKKKQRDANRPNVVMALKMERVESEPPTYLLTWNPKKWPWTNLADESLATALGHQVIQTWSCGTTKKIKRGDRLFLLRQGLDPKGVMAAGWAGSGVQSREHWDARRGVDGEQSLMIEVRFDRILNPEIDDILTLDRLREGPLAAVNWNTPASGIQIKEGAEDLERLWAQLVESHREFGDQDSGAIEGELRLAMQRHRKREAWLRDKKLAEVRGKQDGKLPCEACGFDFLDEYGEIGRDYAQVHHLKPLSERTRPSQTNLSDLVILCANCHAMIHRGGENRPLNAIARKDPRTRLW